jgi:hypothetical protein
MDRQPLHSPEPTSAPGDFYVEDKCCASCGVPQVAAPDLVEWVNDREFLHCRWKKQPSTPEELKQAFAIFDGQELGCHRYAGIDPEVQERIGIENCDYPLNMPREDSAKSSPILSRSLKQFLATRSKKRRKW